MGCHLLSPLLSKSSTSPCFGNRCTALHHTVQARRGKAFPARPAAGCTHNWSLSTSAPKEAKECGPWGGHGKAGTHPNKARKSPAGATELRTLSNRFLPPLTGLISRKHLCPTAAAVGHSPSPLPGRSRIFARLLAHAAGFRKVATLARTPLKGTNWEY